MEAAERTIPITISDPDATTGANSERDATMLITIMKPARLNTGSLAADAFRALRTVCARLWRWRQQRLAASELHSLSDYSLRDIGIARSYIDEQVRLSATRYARPTKSTGLI